MVTSEPLSPAFREALLEDVAKIPGVTVEGQIGGEWECAIMVKFYRY
jgi:hypothetical protein